MIDFERFRPLMASCYSADWGRPAKEPLLLLKLIFLQYHDRLSDNRVIEAARVNIAYREFLDLGLSSDLPHASLLSYFRARLGAEVFRQIFAALVAQAREHGLVKDRLRLKDATHVIANVAIPATIRLVAGLREWLLQAIAAYDPLYAQGQRAQAEIVQAADQGATAQERLEARVTHLREIAAWTETRLHPTNPADEAADAALLVRQEEQAHGNDVEALSGDSALFQGEKLRELTDPEGLNLAVFVPPPPQETAYFTAEGFRVDDSGQTVTCPAGQESAKRDRNRKTTVSRTEKAQTINPPSAPIFRVDASSQHSAYKQP